MVMRIPLIELPSPIIKHNVSIDDDYNQMRAECKCGWSFTSDRRAKKMAMAYRHIADQLDPPEAVA